MVFSIVFPYKNIFNSIYTCFYFSYLKIVKKYKSDHLDRYPDKQNKEEIEDYFHEWKISNKKPPEGGIFEKSRTSPVFRFQNLLDSFLASFFSVRMPNVAGVRVLLS